MFQQVAIMNDSLQCTWFYCQLSNVFPHIDFQHMHFKFATQKMITLLPLRIIESIIAENICVFYLEK